MTATVVVGKAKGILVPFFPNTVEVIAVIF